MKLGPGGARCSAALDFGSSHYSRLYRGYRGRQVTGVLHCTSHRVLLRAA